MPRAVRVKHRFIGLFGLCCEDLLGPGFKRTFNLTRPYIYDRKSEQVTNHQLCIWHCVKSNRTVKKQELFYGYGVSEAPLIL
jgi:hypothetical protein